MQARHGKARLAHLPLLHNGAPIDTHQPTDAVQGVHHEVELLGAECRLGDATEPGERSDLQVVVRGVPEHPDELLHVLLGLGGVKVSVDLPEGDHDGIKHGVRSHVAIVPEDDRRRH